MHKTSICTTYVITTGLELEITTACITWRT